MTADPIIWHNPRCSKSRETLKLLQDRNIELEIVEYLKDHPTVEDIVNVLSLLNVEPLDIIRTGEAVYKENYRGKSLSREDLIDAMVLHPILIQRPIVIANGKAALGRPPESVLNLFQD